MAIRFWNPNAASAKQVVTFTVTAVAAGGTLTVTCNGKSVTYTCLNTDTTTTAATALTALLQPTATPTAPPLEFGDAQWTSATNVVTATASIQGTPFTFTSSSGGGATLVQATVTANSSPSDVNNASNWLTSGGATGLPSAADDLIIANSNVPLLWNLDQLAAVALNSLTIWNDMTANIGLPELNPAGYIEYRQTYFQILATTVTVGMGTGTGSGLMRLNQMAGATTWEILSTGTPGTGTDFALRLLGTNAGNVLKITSGSVAMGMLPGESANVSGGVTVNGGSVSLGQSVTLAGALNVNNGASAEIRNVPSSIVTNGGTLVFFAPVASPATYATVTVQNGGQGFWTGPGTITTHTLSQGSQFSKLDPAALTITNSTYDQDCLLSDAFNGCTWTNATTIRGPISSGIIQTGIGRTIKVT